ncbi:hypothetical protein [Acinetobacter stercoris]|uniref:DUF3147 family protein n=1 Tax=Acinetobacter stercoris TaxID=2126983 RepID=A0A2U3MYU7_9GAMM|nr:MULTISPECIES: hypothetical protein [Acinetobacter]SPL70533.1 hypothetical protein KPC_1711 [Acinetobacter stercoris]
MKLQKFPKIHADWLSKTFAGVFLGFAFSVCIAAIVTLLSFGRMEAVLAPQMGMWTIPWIWCPVFFLAYFIPRGWQVIVIYSVATAVAYLGVLLLRG